MHDKVKIEGGDGEECLETISYEVKAGRIQAEIRVQSIIPSNQLLAIISSMSMVAFRRKGRMRLCRGTALFALSGFEFPSRCVLGGYER